MICKIYLVRHGQSVDNSNGLYGGQHDTPLTEKGRQQAKETKALFTDVHFDDAYSSDLLRASQTAEIIFGKPIAADHQLEALRERTAGIDHDGIWPEEDWFELNKDFDEKYGTLPYEQRWDLPYADFIEKDKALYERFSKAMLAIAAKHQGQTILIGAHGGCIRNVLMKLGYANLLTAGSFKNAGYVELLSDGKGFQIEKVVGVDADFGSAE
jgi:broad specificity phosphatase PhoE